MKPSIPEVLPLIKEYIKKSENAAGGSLHILLEDGNVRDSDVLYCVQWAKERRDFDGVKIGELLLQMSKTQRTKISNWYSVFQRGLV